MCMSTSNLKCFRLRRYVICTIDAKKGLDGALRLSVAGLGCIDIGVNEDSILPNPAVFFDDNTPPNRALSLDGRTHELSDQELFLTDDLDDPNCDTIPPARYEDMQIVVGSLESQYFLFDPQTVLLENSLETPLPDGGGNQAEQSRLTKTEIDNDRTASGYQVGATGKWTRLLWWSRSVAQHTYAH